MPPYRLEAPPQKHELETFAPPERLFEAASFWIVDDLPADYKAMLIDTITAAGGTVIENMMACQYILANPPFPNEPWHIKFLKLSAERDLEHDPIPVIRPYYWVHDCLLRTPARLLFASDIHTKAIFAQADENGRRSPVRVYISINLSPRPGEGSASKVALHIERLILQHGGVRVLLRAKSDILILDQTTRQGKEFAEAAKPHQTVRAREWVEQMVESKTPMGRDLISGTIVAKSLVQMDAKAKPPRQDFTRDDDEKIARYIAFAAPEMKSLKSLTFYRELLDPDMEHIFGWAHRHTAESWRERVRKREDMFITKVRALQNSEIDQYLRTRAERQQQNELLDSVEARRLAKQGGKESGQGAGNQKNANVAANAGASTKAANDTQRDERKASGSKRKADHAAIRETSAETASGGEASDQAGPDVADRAYQQKRQKLVNAPRDPTPPQQDAGPPAAVPDMHGIATAVLPLTEENLRAAATSQSPAAAQSSTDHMQVDGAGEVAPVPVDNAIVAGQEEERDTGPEPIRLGHAGPRRLEQVDPFADEWESPPVTLHVQTATKETFEPANNVPEAGAIPVPLEIDEQMHTDEAEQRKISEEDEVVGYIVMAEGQASGSEEAGPSRRSGNEDDDDGEDSDASILRDAAAGHAARHHLKALRGQTIIEESVDVQVIKSVAVTAIADMAVDQDKDFVAETQAESKMSDDEVKGESQDKEDDEDDEDDPADTLDVAAYKFFAPRAISAAPPPPPEDLPARKRLSMGLPLQPVGRKAVEDEIVPAVERSIPAHDRRKSGSRRVELDARPLRERSVTPSSEEGFSRHDGKQRQLHNAEANNVIDRSAGPSRIATIVTPMAQPRSARSSSGRGTPAPDYMVALTQKLCRQFNITAKIFLEAVLKPLIASGGPVTESTLQEALEQYMDKR